jgi:hypothetical protein
MPFLFSLALLIIHELRLFKGMGRVPKPAEGFWDLLIGQNGW